MWSLLLRTQTTFRIRLSGGLVGEAVGDYAHMQLTMPYITLTTQVWPLPHSAHILMHHGLPFVAAESMREFGHVGNDVIHPEPI